MSGLDFLEVDYDWGLDLSLDPALKFPEPQGPEDFRTLTGCELEHSDNSVCFVAAFTGDDAIHFTNSKTFVHAMISNEIQMDIRISEKDTGISHKMGNFAEEWIITPLTSEMSWEDTNAIHKQDGLPWAFDAIKLKNGSSIRKGGMDETANPYDKVAELSKRAQWAVEGWMTYDDHQLLSIMAKCSLDISDGPYSPLLFPTEGGVGACAEWHNILNTLGLLGRYCQKKTLLGTYMIMKESDMINKGQIRPDQAYSTRLLHLSQLDLDLWKRFAKLLANWKFQGYNSEIEVWDDLNHMTGASLPPDLLEKSLVLTHESFIEGTMISRLRNLGLIMTELDVRLEMNQYDRYLATASNDNAGIYIKSLDEKKEKLKARPLHMYRSFLGKKVDHFELQLSEDNIFNDFRQVAINYLKNRVESVIPHTAFSYRSTTRIFKASDVRKYAPYRELGFLRKQLKGEENPWIPAGISDPFEEEKYREIEKWIESTTLDGMIKTAIPLGVTTDDARLLSDFQFCKQEFQGHKLLNIVVTEDRRLFSALKVLEEPSWFEIMRLDLKSYLGLCLGIGTYDKPKNPYASFHNILTGNCDQAPDLPNWGNERDFILFHFDVPNIERNVRGLQFMGTHVTQFSSGYIQRKFALNAMKQGNSIYFVPWNNLYKFIRRPTESIGIPPLRKIFLKSC